MCQTSFSFWKKKMLQNFCYIICLSLQQYHRYIIRGIKIPPRGNSNTENEKRMEAKVIFHLSNETS